MLSIRKPGERDLTTIGEHESVCIACGESSRHAHINSTNTMGAPDLDLRPAPMQRHTMNHWLEECPACGFVAAQIGKEDDKAAAAWKAGAVDRDRLGDVAGLARLFLTRSLLEESLGRFGPAANNALHAAWASDDTGGANATQLRLRALELSARAPLSGDPLTHAAMRIDLLRRAKRWDEAAAAADALLAQPDVPPVVRSVASFGRDRANGHDAAGYTVKDATDRFPA